MRTFGWSLFVLGLMTLALGIVYPGLPRLLPNSIDFYGLVVERRSNLTNRGGALAICGAVLITRPRERQ